jgi:hypothetical protein
MNKMLQHSQNNLFSFWTFFKNLFLNLEQDDAGGAGRVQALDPVAQRHEQLLAVVLESI